MSLVRLRGYGSSAISMSVSNVVGFVLFLKAGTD